MVRSRRNGTLAVAVVLALLATVLVQVASQPTASAAPLDVYERPAADRRTWRGIEAPSTVVERWEEFVIDSGPQAGSYRCIHQVYFRLDVEALSELPYSAWTGAAAQEPRYWPTSFTAFNPRVAGLSLSSQPVVDLAELSAQTGYDFGTGVGMRSRSFATTLRDGCSQYHMPLSEVLRPVLRVEEFGANLDVSVTPTGEPNTYRFQATAVHPVIPALPLTFHWQFEGGDRVEDVAEGEQVTHTFTSDDPESFLHRFWNVEVRNGDHGVIDQASGRTQSIGVGLKRPEGEEDEPIVVGEPFVVELELSASEDNYETIRDISAYRCDTGVGCMQSDPLILPDWIELVDGPLGSGFDLAPGEQIEMEFTLVATDDQTGEIRTNWQGVDDRDEFLRAGNHLPIEAVSTFDGDWFRLDSASEGVKVDETAEVRLRADNATGTELHDVELVDVSVTGIGDTPGEARLEPATQPHEGEDSVLSMPGTLDGDGPGSVGFADYDLIGVTEGPVVLRGSLRGTTPDGDVIEGEIEEEWQVRATDLTVDISFDPPEKLQVESDDPEAPPEPVEMTATFTLTNTSGGPLTDVTIEEFEISRAIGEQQLWLEQSGGYPVTNAGMPGILLEQYGTDDPAEPFDLDDGEDRVFTADFIARDDGDVEFHVLALAADAGDQTVRGYGENTWIVAPEKYLEVVTDVAIPQDGELLTAGQEIVVTGRVVNLSQTASLEVGPLIPVPTGNTGLLSLAYGGGRAPDPRETPPVPDMLELGPGDSELFEVAIVTGYSDPRTDFDTGEPTVEPSGGTRAYLEFDPWAIATEADGTVRTVRTDPQSDEDRGVKLAEDDRELIVSIDDSIAIPETEYALLAGGFSLGVVKGIGRAGVGMLVGVVEVAKLPYTLSVGAMEYQSRVWNSFTEEEKELFGLNLTTYLVGIAIRSAENGLEAAADTPAFVEKVNDMVFREMTRLADEWETGDYVSTAEAYGAGGSEIAASLWMPAAMTKLAQTPRAAAALTRAQGVLNARMVPIFDAARGVRYVEDALPLLRAIENGAEITGDVMRTLYGISPDEVAELQRLAQKYQVLLTVRSRHPSSIEWIRKFGAMMKPEAIKIKSVSELDVKLGYRADDLGSVVFRKPEPLRGLDGPIDDFTLQARTESFVRGRGISPGTKEFDSAVDRMKLRVKEWRKHETAYKKYDRRKAIPTEFDYEGNAIPDLRTPSSKQRQTGFKLDEVGPDEYVVRLQDPTDGKYKRVTGDIDPIAFTNLDGSPLTPAQHRDLLNEMRSSAKLRAQHPESATFVGTKNADGTWDTEPGLDFIESQFKPGEAAAQIGPAGPARAVRLNKGASRWKDSFDYHLRWEGGYVHVGGRKKITQQTDFDPDFGRNVEVEVPLNIKPRPMDLGTEGEATYGRCKVTISSAATAPAIFLDDAGQAVEASPDGTVSPSPEGEACLLEGPLVTLEVAPAAAVVTESSGDGFARRSFDVVRDGFGLATASTAPSASAIGVVEVTVDAETPMSWFVPGQEVFVGGPTGGAVATVVSVAGRTIRLDRPIAVTDGDVLAVVGQPASPPAPGPSPGGNPGGAVGGSGTGSGTTPGVQPGSTGSVDGRPNAVAGTLPTTGSDVADLLRAALGLLLLGFLLVRADPRSRAGDAKTVHRSRS